MAFAYRMCVVRNRVVLKKIEKIETFAQMPRLKFWVGGRLFFPPKEIIYRAGLNGAKVSGFPILKILLQYTCNTMQTECNVSATHS
jgi:hypothetical protein